MTNLVPIKVTPQLKKTLKRVSIELDKPLSKAGDEIAEFIEIGKKTHKKKPENIFSFK